MSDFNRVALMGKLRKAKRLADEARFSLLDVVIFLNDVETTLSASADNGEARSGLLGEGESREGDQPGESPERDQ